MRADAERAVQAARRGERRSSGTAQPLTLTFTRAEFCDLAPRPARACGGSTGARWRSREPTFEEIYEASSPACASSDLAD